MSAGFGTARLGEVRNHAFFIVSAVNVGERAITVREIEWEAGPDVSFTLHVVRHSKGRDLPAKVEADEELRVLFDSEIAAKAIARSEHRVTAINVLGSGRKRFWQIEITQPMRDEAEEELRLAREVDADDHG